VAAALIAKVASAEVGFRAARERDEARRRRLDAARAGMAAATAEVVEAQAAQAAAERAGSEAEAAAQRAAASAAEAEAEAQAAAAAAAEAAAPVPSGPAVLGRYVAARLAAAQRADLGALPLIVVDPFVGLDEAMAAPLLESLAASSTDVQVIYLSEDPSVVAWARTLGTERARVLRFSPAAG